MENRRSAGHLAVNFFIGFVLAMAGLFLSEYSGKKIGSPDIEYWIGSKTQCLSACAAHGCAERKAPAVLRAVRQ